MTRFWFAMCLTMFVLPAEAIAAARELDQSELRKATASGKMISLKRVIDQVVDYVGGTAIDARAFEAEEIFYRILVKMPDGKIVSVVVNARTGKSLSGQSKVRREITAAAKSSRSKSNNGKSKSGRGNNNAGGNGKGNGGGGGGGGGGGNGGGGGGGGKK